MKRQKDTKTSAPLDALDEPVVVPFRGDGWKYPSLLDGDPPDAQPVADERAIEQLASDVATARIAKLRLLAERYGINIDDPNAGLELALRIAIDHHPGFKVVYDDWQARMVHRLHGATPFHPLRGAAPKQIENKKNRGEDKSSDFFEPELLAIMIPPKENRKSKKADRELCEAFVKAADPEMNKRKNAKIADSRAETLNRRLTEGRRRLSKNK